MIFFIVGAVALWAATLLLPRRRTAAAVAVAGSLLAFALVHGGTELLFYAFNWPRPPAWLLAIGDAYCALVLVVGLFLAAMPRRIPPHHCASCRYDLTGNTTGRCPECGEHLPDHQRSLVTPEPSRA